MTGPVDRILEGVRGISIESSGETIEITSSAGVATLLDAEESPSELMHRPDDAPYRANDEGRDGLRIRAEVAPSG